MTLIGIFGDGIYTKEKDLGAYFIGRLRRTFLKMIHVKHCSLSIKSVTVLEIFIIWDEIYMVPMLISL